MNKKDSLPTVTVGVPAFNEEGHIISLLEAILAQKQTNFLLKKIVVMCDGGKDTTAELVEKFAEIHTNVICINDKVNKGKSARLNQLYSVNTSNILVTFDADTIPANTSVLANLVKAFDDENVGLVGGHDMPVKPKRFFEKIACTAIDIWYETRKDINGGDCVHNHHGCISAVSKSFAKNLRIPKEITSDDEYLYFAAKKAGFSFRFAEKALLYYRAPATLRDYLIQSSRFIDTKHIIMEKLGAWVEPYYPIARSHKIKGIVTMMKREPIFTPLAISLQLLLRVLQPLYQKTYKKGKWMRISSTKILA